MDASKILTLVCALLLGICLVLSITALTVLRNAVEESGAQSESNAALIESLRACVNELEESEVSDSLPTDTDAPTSTEVPDNRFCVKETNGRIGIYTADGYLIRLLEVSVDTLPPADREALSSGICVDSWRELISIIQDYTA